MRCVPYAGLVAAAAGFSLLLKPMPCEAQTSERSFPPLAEETGSDEAPAPVAPQQDPNKAASEQAPPPRGSHVASEQEQADPRPRPPTHEPAAPQEGPPEAETLSWGSEQPQASPPPYDRGGQPHGRQYAEPPPPPPLAAPPQDGSGFPEFSVRADPLTALLQGRLGIEMEVAAWEFISLELVPIVVVNSEPVAFNFTGREDTLSQDSNGLGPISGTSVGAGFWLGGTPFRGYVLRAIFTNYGYTYKSSSGGNTFDSVDVTERQLLGFLGSHSKFGAFTIAGGFGIGVELNRQSRCEINHGSVQVSPSQCDEDDLLIGLNGTGTQVTNLNSQTYPIALLARFSLGVVF